MIRTCDGTDEYLRGEDGKPCGCGRTFDDVDRLTVWPHYPVSAWSRPVAQDQAGPRPFGFPPDVQACAE